MLSQPRVLVGAFVAVVAALALVALLQGWTPAAWAALAAWTTAGIATVAGTVAVRQLGLAQNVRLEHERSRREQAQPNVVAYIEPSAASSVLIDLVVRNFGVTPAHQVRLDITPKPRRAIDKNDPEPQMWLPEQIPVLVPGQEWRTLWDSGITRVNSDLPTHHDAVVKFRDSQGNQLSTRAVLDWRMYIDRETVTVYGAHDAAKALRDISKAIAKWGEGAGGGLSVWARDGDARDTARRERREAQLAERAASDGEPPATPTA